MSGLELVGVAASILQIAEIGGQLSIKLCTFCHKVKNADKNLQNLSNDVALTSNVLRHLGDSLEQDKQGQLYSKHALNTAQDVLGECTKVFEEIGDAIDCPDGNSTKHKVSRVVTKIGFVLREPQLDVLKSNLERLKSTMLLMLNVIMYAGQIQSRLDSKILQEQRELIQTLMNEKRSTDERFRELKKTLEVSKTIDDYSSQPRPRDLESSTISLATIGASLPVPPRDDLEEYFNLITKILSDIDTCKSDLDSARYRRISGSAWDIHSAEIRHIETTHGRSASEWLQRHVIKALREAIHEPYGGGIDPMSAGSRRMERVTPRPSSHNARRRQYSSPTEEDSIDEHPIVRERRSCIPSSNRRNMDSSDNERRRAPRSYSPKGLAPAASASAGLMDTLGSKGRLLLRRQRKSSSETAGSSPILSENKFYEVEHRVHDGNMGYRRRRSYTRSRPSVTNQTPTDRRTTIATAYTSSNKTSYLRPSSSRADRTKLTSYQDYSSPEVDYYDSDSSGDDSAVERCYQRILELEKSEHEQNTTKKNSQWLCATVSNQTRRHDRERRSSDYELSLERQYKLSLQRRRRRHSLIRRKRMRSSDEDSHSSSSPDETGETMLRITAPPTQDQQTEATVSGEIPEIDELVLEWTTLRKDEINI